VAWNIFPWQRIIIRFWRRGVNNLWRRGWWKGMEAMDDQTS
jgi:hypothetical protein